MVGVLLLDELSKEGVLRPGSKRNIKFMKGEPIGLLPITKRRLEILDGKKR